jgi:hypothetical protein
MQQDSFQCNEMEGGMAYDTEKGIVYVERERDRVG